MNTQLVQTTHLKPTSTVNKSEIDENTISDLNFEENEKINKIDINDRKSIESVFPDSEKFLEIRPETINKIIFSEDLCKISFKVLTHNTPVEILYNPTRNMFNAFSLILFNLRNDSNSLDKLSTGKLPVNENPDKLIQKLRDKATDILVSWMRNKDNIDFIDRISLMLTGQYHFIYNDKFIWNEDGTIINDILDLNGRVQLNKLTHRKDNILERIKGNSPISGTWLNFEFLPEMLRISNINYRVLANHYQALLLPKLSLENKSFESEVKQLDEWYHSLYDDYVKSFKEIDEEKTPALKGSATERLTIKILNQVFNPHPEEYNNIEHIGQSEKHTCDIRIIDEQILVEVKMVKSQPYHGNNKFIRDLKENASTTKAGIYINWATNDIQTHIEQNPLRFYINRKDFNVPFLKIIQNTLINENGISTIRSQIENKYNNQLAHNMEVSEKLIQNGTIFYTNIMKAMLARMKLDPNIKSYVNITDAENEEKVLETIQRGDSKEIFDEYVKEFISLNFDKFKVGYITEDAKLDLLEYTISKGLYFMTEDDMSAAFKSRLRLDRHLAPRKYKFMKGTENIYNQIDISKIDKTNLTNYEEAVSKGMTTYEKSVEQFLSLPENQLKINNPDGFKTDNFNQKYSEYVKNIIKPESFGITYYRFMKYYYQYMVNNFIQITCKKKTKYINSTSEKGINLLSSAINFFKSYQDKEKAKQYINDIKVLEKHFNMLGLFASLTCLLTRNENMQDNAFVYSIDKN